MTIYSKKYRNRYGYVESNKSIIKILTRDSNTRELIWHVTSTKWEIYLAPCDLLLNM